MRQRTRHLAAAVAVGLTVLTVAAFRPRRAPFPECVRCSGKVEPAREAVRVGAGQSGVISRIYIEPGQSISPGVPLLQIDSREREAEMRALAARLTALHAQLREAEALLAERRSLYARLAPLARRGILSRQEGERARLTVVQAESLVERMKAEIQSGGAALEKCRAGLDQLTIRCPMDATVLQVNIRAGEALPQDSSEPLILLSENRRLLVRATIGEEEEEAKVRPGALAVAYVDNPDNRPIPLRFVRVEPATPSHNTPSGRERARPLRRPMEILYRLDAPEEYQVRIGEKVDVYIETPKGRD